MKRELVNTTQHHLYALDCDRLEQGICNPSGKACRVCSFGKVVSIPPSGTIISSTPVEKNKGKHPSGAKLFTLTFKPQSESLKKLVELEKRHPEAILIGGIINATTFSGRIYGICPVPGYERVAVGEKLIRTDKFLIFDGR